MQTRKLISRRRHTLIVCRWSILCKTPRRNIITCRGIANHTGQMSKKARKNDVRYTWRTLRKIQRTFERKVEAATGRPSISVQSNVDRAITIYATRLVPRVVWRYVSLSHSRVPNDYGANPLLTRQCLECNELIKSLERANYSRGFAIARGESQERKIRSRDSIVDFNINTMRRDTRFVQHANTLYVQIRKPHYTACLAQF